MVMGADIEKEVRLFELWMLCVTSVRNARERKQEKTKSETWDQKRVMRHEHLMRDEK